MSHTPLSLLKKTSQSLLNQQLDETNDKLKSKVFELHLAMNYLTNVLNHMAQGILFVGFDGTITTYNSVAEQLIGKENETVLFNPFWDSFPDNFFGFSLQQALKENQAPKKTSLSLDHRELEISTSFVLDDASSHEFQGFDFNKGLIILIRDITEVRRLELIANRNDRMKELGEMASMVAHEIRNPLGGIKGFASLLVRDLKESPHARDGSIHRRRHQQLKPLSHRHLELFSPYATEI